MDLRGKTIALTGATGFLGSRIAHNIDRAGARLKLLSRPGVFDRVPVSAQIIEGDLASQVSLNALVRDVDAVVHCAGATRAFKSQDFFDVNAKGTARIAESARRAGTPRFILVSSLTAQRPKASDYAASKAAGEAALLRTYSGQDWLILRPPAIYGAGDELTKDLIYWLKRGAWPNPKGPDGARRTSFIHVDDAAAAIVAGLHRDAPTQAIYAVDGAEPMGVTWREAGQIFADTLDCSAPRFAPPKLMLLTFAGISAGIARARGAAPMLTPDKVRELFAADWVSAPRWSTTGLWAPKYTLKTGSRAIIHDA